MPSSSPSPMKRPSMAERTSSTHSLSSSGKQTSQHKVHRVSRHARNVSYGKGLAKLGKINSTTNIAGDGRNHARKKSGPTTPAHSPKTPVSPHMKRNSSHATLPKNTSHGNLRKNQSATALAPGRTSTTSLKKLGAPPSQKQNDEHKQGFFELGDQSSGAEDEGEWEDSTTQSPEMSKNHSKASTPLRPRTPNGDAATKNAGKNTVEKDDLISPPDAAVTTANRSLPNLRKAAVSSADIKPTDPALLHGQSRASRAPPAVSTISARVQGSEASRSSSKSLAREDQMGPSSMATSGMGATSSSGSQGVSHFLPSTSLDTSRKSVRDDSDDDETSELMANYKPQPSNSPGESKLHNKARVSSVPSRTQQRLELQRREMMRAGGPVPVTPANPGLALSAGSSVSLHSRSGSKGHSRTLGGDPKLLQHDYAAGLKQLTVVRRYRNPVLEGLSRLRDRHGLLSDGSSTASINGATKSRPQSRRGFTGSTSTPKGGLSTSSEDRKTVPQISRASSRSRAPRVQFQMSRQGSHDDILTTRGSPGDTDDEQDDSSPEEALIRRIWESQVSFEVDGSQSPMGQTHGGQQSRLYPV